jgi:hypothetical protein
VGVLQGFALLQHFLLLHLELVQLLLQQRVGFRRVRMRFQHAPHVDHGHFQSAGLIGAGRASGWGSTQARGGQQRYRHSIPIHALPFGSVISGASRFPLPF